MRKQYQRLMSMLLVVVMVLAMLPTFASAAKTVAVEATPLEGMPADNQSVVIYSASAGGVFSGTADGGAIGVSKASTFEENNNISVGNGAGVYKLVKNADGTYYITCGGKYLFIDSKEYIDLKDSPVSGTKWKIAPATGLTGYTLINNDSKYNGTQDIYLEYYGAIKGWTLKDTLTEIYTFTFYAIDEQAADPDGDGYIGQKPEAGELPADGSKVAIYNDNGGMTFGAQSDDATAPSMTGVASAQTDAGLDCGNGTLIFDVTFDGTYYTFANNGKYLRTSANDGDSNAECIYMDELDSDYSYWTLEKCSGGYIMYNKTAKYKNNRVAIEYFNNCFSGWTYNGSVGLFAMKFFPVEDSLNLGYVLNPKMTVKTEEAYVGVDHEFTVILDELSKVTSLDVTYALDGGAAKAAALVSNEGYVYNYSIPAADLAGKQSLTINGVAKNEYGMTYEGAATVTINDVPLILSVNPAANGATGTDKTPVISAQVANCGANPTVVMKVDGAEVTPTVTASQISYQPAAALPDGRHTVELTVTRADGKTAGMTWSFFVGEAGISLYFGQLHSHTAEYSDGAGQLEDAYEYAMKAKDVDFLIVTDHSNYFDTTSSNSMASYYDYSTLTMSGSITKWQEAKETAEKYNALSDDFVAAYGYEMTWSGGPGHTNSFNTYGPISRNNPTLNEKTNSYAGMHKYNDLMVNANRGLDVNGEAVAEGVKTKWLEDAPVVSQFNHPGVTFGTFDDFAGYTPARDEVLNLVEVGNGEGAVGGSSYFPSYSEYDKALAKGWHVAPTNNQDNHKGKWGDANTCRDVIVTDDFTEAGLYKAIAARQVYSTEDQNLQIYYYLNDNLMGSIIDVGDTVPESVHVVASISDPDGEKLSTVEVIGENGMTLKKVETNASTYELDVTLPNSDAYYYLKITEADGDIAVTAPVWVGEATPIVADIDTDAALCVAGTDELITATVSNEADADYTIEKVEFILTVGGSDTVIKTISEVEDAVVAAGSKKVVSFTYTRTMVDTSLEKESQKITVVFYGKYNGKDFKCQANMTQNVRDPEKLIKVAIDGGHDNYYVSGDYAGSMGNFIEYCADNGIQCDILGEGELTYSNLKYYKMLILTVNYRRNTAKAKDYTEQELADIQKYAQRGGNIILASKSDRDNKFDNCAANSNQILEAINANTRVVDGIVVDNDMKANEAYRIYFSSKSNFSSTNRFMTGAYTSSNAFGTTSSPENQTGFQLYNGAPIRILDESKVEVMVRGYQSTWGSHYDGYFTGGSFVPEYNATDATGRSTTTVEMDEVNLMTYEDLPGGGWLIVSGCTFFSNYDIKSDQDYVNKYIVLNIIRELTGVDDNLEITPIKTVKAVPEERSGEQYTIEGYVTSNASAYDQDTAFFDCIYVQDKKGNGINAFPVAGNYAIGMNVRAHGGVTYYCGEIELNLSTDYNGYIRVISDEIYKVPPKEVDCKTAMADASIGNLMSVKGIVTSIHKTEGVIDKIYVRDAAGEACFFINGYIMKDYKGLDDLKVGMLISGVGIGSRDVDETSATAAIFSRLRVRDRREIKILSNGEVHMELLFNDVSKSDWFYNEVVYVVNRDLLIGTSHSEFSPNATLTRAMAATVLYRLAGEPEVTSTASFTDVPAGIWYEKAVAWAQANNVVKGYENNTFRPDVELTRQEMAVMLSRYATNVAGIEIEASGDLNGFRDGDKVASWAYDALVWAAANQIIRGMDGKIAPNENATRAQFAAIIMRFAQLYNL